MVLSARAHPRSAAFPAPRRASAGLTVAGVAAGLLAAYVVVYPLFGLRVTIGSDTPVYVWWARLGGAAGMGPLGSGSRPGAVGLIATLARVTPAPAAGVVAAVLPALAVATGLAAGALVDVTFGEDRPRFVLVATFTAAYLSLLTDGYVSTLAFGSAFVASLACFAAALRERREASEHQRTGGPELGAGGALLAAAGLSHPLFLALAAGILGTALIALAPSALRQARSGVPLRALGAVRVAGAALLGAAAVPVGLALSGGFAAAPVDTSRDAFLRQAGLGDVLRSSYLHKLRHDFPWWRVVTVLGLASTALAVARRSPGERPEDGGERRPLFWGAMLGWIVISAAGVVLLLAGTSAPGQRLFAFCLALPILGGVGLAALWWPARSGEASGAGAARPGGTARRAGVVAAAVLFLAMAWARWLGERPLVGPELLTQARNAGIALGATPQHPLVVVMHPGGPQPSGAAITNANYLRDEVAPLDIPRAHVVLAAPADYAAGRPTLVGNPESDAYSRLSSALAPPISATPLAVAIRSFDARAYAAVLAMPGRHLLAPGVVTLPSSAYPPPVAVPAADVGPGPQSPWLPVWEAPLVLALAALVGWPIAALLLPAAGARVRAAISASLGFAALALASVVVDGIGIHLSAAGGWAALGLALFLPWITFAARRNQGGLSPRSDPS